MADQLAIELENVSHYFGDHKVIDELSLTVKKGEVFGFLGHNGAGKTTTIRLLNGVLTPDEGTIKVLGLNPARDGPHLRGQTGVLTETPSLDERLSALDNLKFYADLFAVPVIQVNDRVDAMLRSFSLAERANDKVAGFSKGMKQRLALARAFLHKPQLIFLDEPTSGLDPVGAKEVHEMIRHISSDEGRTVFLCTHNLVEAQRLCNRVGVIEEGRLVAIGTPKELAAELGADLRYVVQVAESQHQWANELLRNEVIVTRSFQNDGEFSITVQSRDEVSEILAKMLSADIKVHGLIPQETSLEDIYLALHKRGRVEK